MPVAHVWPPLPPHVSIEPVAVGMLTVRALEVGFAEVGKVTLEVIDAGVEEYMDPVVAMNADGLSLSNVSGRKFEIEGGPLGLPEPQSLRS